VKKISATLYRLSSGWLVLLSGAALLVFTLFVLPTFNVITSEFAGELGVPDLRFVYSPSTLQTMAAAYGEFGRASYITLHWTLDLAFPLLYSLFLVTGSSWLLAKLTPLSSKYRMLNLIPLIVFLGDIGENAFSSVVMARFPQPCAAAQVLSAIFTPVKWLGFIAAILLLVVAGALFFKKWYSSRMKDHSQ
jgi:hypothetical protein